MKNKKKPLKIYSFRLNEESIERLKTKFGKGELNELIRKAIDDLSEDDRCRCCGQKLK